jgi:hypothetical protein
MNYKDTIIKLIKSKPLLYGAVTIALLVITFALSLSAGNDIGKFVYYITH